MALPVQGYNVIFVDKIETGSIVSHTTMDQNASRISLADSFTIDSNVGFSSNYWITPNAMVAIDSLSKYSWLSDVNGDNPNNEKMVQERLR